MLDLLAPMPDHATLQAMATWAGWGMAGTTALWIASWIYDRAATERLIAGWLPEAEFPTRAEGDPRSRWKSPAGFVQALALGAAMGALWRWSAAGPNGMDHKIEFAMEVFAATAAVYGLTRVTSEMPAVGEPPADDPDKAPQALFWRRLGHLGLTVLMVLMAWERLH